MRFCRIHKPRPTKCVVISEMDVNQRKTLGSFPSPSFCHVKVETCDFSELVHLIDSLIYTLSSCKPEGASKFEILEFPPEQQA